MGGRAVGVRHGIRVGRLQRGNETTDRPTADHTKGSDAYETYAAPRYTITGTKDQAERIRLGLGDCQREGKGSEGPDPGDVSINF